MSILRSSKPRCDSSFSEVGSPLGGSRISWGTRLWAVGVTMSLATMGPGCGEWNGASEGVALRSGADGSSLPSVPVPGFPEGVEPDFPASDPQPVPARILPTASVGVTPGGMDITASGTVTYTLPIAVAPGPAGVEPTVRLVYSSSGGNGMLGMGFSLQASSAIVRGGKNLREDGVRDGMQLTADDGLYLNGARLYAVEGVSGADGTVYHTKPQTFVKVVGVGSIQDPESGFVADLPDGSKQWYGTSQESRTLLASGAPHPTEANLIPYAWNLQRSEDRFGNAIVYDYDFTLNSQGTQAHRLARIRYTENLSAGVVAKREVRMGYSLREDVQRGYVKGAFMENPYLLTRIEVWAPTSDTHEAGEDAVGLIRWYSLDYERPTITGRSLLTSVQEHTSLGGKEAHKQPTRFRYEEGSTAFGSGNHLNENNEGEAFGFSETPFPEGPSNNWAPDEWTFGITLLKLLTGDYNNDGRSDMMLAPESLSKSTIHWGFWPGTGWHPTNQPYTPLYTSLPSDPLISSETWTGWYFAAPPGSQVPAMVVNSNGDGLDDILYRQNPPYNEGESVEDPLANRRYVLLEATGNPDKPFLRKHLPGGDKIFLTGDYNGDGLSDLLYCQRTAQDLAEFSFSFEEGEVMGFTKPEYEVGRTFAYVLNDGEGMDMQDAVATKIPCSDRDLYVQMDVEGNGTLDVLMVPGTYKDGTPVELSAYENYQQLQFDFPHQSVTWVDTGLPVDRLQRVRSSVYQSDSELLWYGHQQGKDRIIDVEGDGLPDVLRLELKAGDGAAQLPEILAFHGEDNPQQDTVLRLYHNTGKGFVKGEAVMAFHHRDVMDTHFKPSALLDIDVDGKLDVVIPGPETKITFGYLHQTATGAWQWDALPSDVGIHWNGAAPLPAMDFNGDGLHDIAVLNHAWSLQLHEGKIPDLLVEVRDGMGDRDRVEYEAEQRHLEGHELLPADVDVGTPISYPRYVAPSVRPIAVRSEHMNAQGRRVYDYDYFVPVADRLGAGGLGYRARRVQELFKNTPNQAWNDVQETLEVYDNHTYDPKLKVYPYRGTVEETRSYATFHRADGAPGESGQEPYVQARLAQTQMGHHAWGEGNYVAYAVESEQQTYEVPAKLCEGGHRCAPEVLQQQEPLSAAYWTALDIDEHGRVVESETQDDPEKPLETVTERVALKDLEDAWVWGLVEQHQVTSKVPFEGPQTRTMEMGYDGQGNLSWAVREPDDADLRLEQRLFYNLQGLTTEVWTKSAEETSDRTTHFAYDPEGVFVVKQTGPWVEGKGRPSVAFSHHRGLGLRMRMRDATGARAYTAYDGFGRPKAAYGVAAGMLLGPVMHTSYQAKDLGTDDWGLPLYGLVVTQGGQGLGTSVVESDRYGRVVHTVNEASFGKNIEQFLGYDGRGRLQHALLPQWVDGDVNGYTRYAYNALDELRTVVAPNQGVTEMRREGRRSGVKDAEGRWSVVEVDRLGRPVFTKGPFMCTQGNCLTSGGDLGQVATMRYQYGTFSHLRSVAPWVADAKMPPVQVVVDKYGRRTQLQDAATGTRHFRYDAYGQLRQEVDAEGQEKTYVYDVLGRVQTITHDRGTERFFYDGQYFGLVDGSHSSAGHQTKVVYDQKRRPVRSETTVMGDGELETFAFTYTYDGWGRLKERLYPQAKGLPPVGVRHHYDAVGQVVAITGLNDKLYWELQDVDVLGHLTKVKLGNGAVHERHYDLQTGLLKTLRTTHPKTGVVQDLHYLFSLGGDLEERADLLHGQVEGFVYDGAGRIVESLVYTKGQSKNEVFTYDGLGNLQSRSKAGSYVYDGPHLKSIVDGQISYTYDKNGNLTTRSDVLGTTSFAYHPWQLIERITTPEGLVAYEYDAWGARIKRMDFIHGTQTLYIGGLYEQERSMKADDGTKTHTYRIPSPQGVVAELALVQDAQGEFSDLEEHYLLTDHLGSLEAVMDLAGEVVERMSFDSFGLHRNPENWTEVYPQQYESKLTVDIGFTGHRGRRDGGVVDMKARLYDPMAGRFLNPDPLISHPLSSQRLNRYSYVLNRPQNLIDPSGMTPWPMEACREGEPGQVPSSVPISMSSRGSGGSSKGGTNASKSTSGGRSSPPTKPAPTPGGGGGASKPASGGESTTPPSAAVVSSVSIVPGSGAYNSTPPFRPSYQDIDGIEMKPTPLLEKQKKEGPGGSMDLNHVLPIVGTLIGTAVGIAMGETYLSYKAKELAADVIRGQFCEPPAGNGKGPGGGNGNGNGPPGGGGRPPPPGRPLPVEFRPGSSALKYIGMSRLVEQGVYTFILGSLSKSSSVGPAMLFLYNEPHFRWSVDHLILSAAQANYRFVPVARGDIVVGPGGVVQGYTITPSWNDDDPLAHMLSLDPMNQFMRLFLEENGVSRLYQELDYETLSEFARQVVCDGNAANQKAY